MYVEAPAGSLILWASNTLHQGSVPEAVVAPGAPPATPPRIKTKADVLGVVAMEDDTEEDTGDSKAEHVAAPVVDAAPPRKVVYVCHVKRAHVPIGTYNPVTKKVTPLSATQRRTWRVKLAKERAKKVLHLLSRRMTRHCPSEPRVFGTMPRTYGDKALLARIRNFVADVEEKGLGAGPIMKIKAGADPDGGNTESDGEGEDDGEEDDDNSNSAGATTRDKKRRKPNKVWPASLPHAVRKALEMAERASRGKGGLVLPEASDALLPTCLADLDAATKARLWRLNGL